MYRATLQYSIPKDGDRSSKSLPNSQDWFCVKCGAHNFKRRDSCFKCSASRQDSEQGQEGVEEVCNYPTNTLLLRGLDVLSIEEEVLQAIQHASNDVPIRSVRIGRDTLTNTSRGVCYIELNSVQDSMGLYNKLAANPPLVEGKQAVVSYCKLPQPGGNQASAATASTWASQHQGVEYTQGADIKQLAEYSAAMYAQTPEEHATYVEYYEEYYQQQAQNTGAGSQSDSVNAAAAVAQSAIQALQHKTEAQASSAAAAAASTASATATSSAATPTTTTASAATSSGDAGLDAEQQAYYSTPDVSQYQYDESSGYYYDPSTGLYYDANSQYYYNAQSGQFLYWDAEKGSYMPAPTDDAEGGKEKGGDKSKEKEKDKQEKVKVAKKIAKDMARWAKAQNRRNETITTTKSSGGEQGGGARSTTGAADAAFSILLERKDRMTDKQSQVFQMVMKKDVTASLTGGNLKKVSGLVAAYGEGSDSEGDDPSMAAGRSTMQAPAAPPTAGSSNDDVHSDWAKLACLLCKRQFPSLEALTKHNGLSSLHKQNIEAWRKTQEDNAGGTDELGAGSNYRDRAKERRQKYGEPNAPPPNRLKERYMAVRDETSTAPADEPTKQGIGSDNMGNRMLKKMGWTEGQGLGKSNQGRTSIIEADRRVQSAGLGMQGSSYSVLGNSYKDCVKKMALHRYQELDQMEKNKGE